MEQYTWNRTTNYNDIGIEQVEEKVRELARCEESCYDADLEIFCTLFSAIYYFNINKDVESRKHLGFLERKKKEFTDEHHYWYHWCCGSLSFWCDWKYNAALPHFLNAAKYGRRLSSDLKLDFKVLHYCTGHCYSEMDYHLMAQEYFDKVKGKLFEAFNVAMSLAIQRSSAMGYSKFAKTEVALDLLENCRTYVIRERKDDRRTLGLIYRDIGRVYQDAKNYEKALEYFNMSSQCFEKNSEDYLVYLCYKASLLRTYNKFDMTNECLNECLDEGLSMAKKRTLWYVWLNAIKESLTLDDESSIRYIKWTSIPRLREYGKNLLVKECCLWLSDHYHSTQDHKWAYEYVTRALEIHTKLMKGDLTLCEDAHYQY